MDDLITFITFITGAFLLCYLLAWYWTMKIVIKAAEDKGYHDDEFRFKMWFIGLFALIFTPPIIVAALPDKAGRDNGPLRAKTIEDELPAL